MAISWKIVFPLLITSVLSGPCSTPTPTAFPDQTQSDSEAPLPTMKPELVKRDDYSPQFCGWLDGLSSYAPCNAFSTCIWRTDISAVGCCRDTNNLNTCGMYTTCINYSNLGGVSLTKSNSLLLLCTDSASPICASARFEPSYYNYFCNPYSTFLDVMTTSTNQTIFQGGIPRFTGPALITFTTNSTISASSIAQSSTTATPVTNTLISATPSPTPVPSHKKAIIGGAVGGAIGGLVAFILIWLLITSCWKKHQKSNVRPVESVLSLGNGFMHYEQAK